MPECELIFQGRGSRTDNAYLESFNGTLRSDCLGAHWIRVADGHEADQTRSRDDAEKGGSSQAIQVSYDSGFHGKLRDECLDASWFGNLWDARRKITAWKEEYNEARQRAGVRGATRVRSTNAALRSAMASCAPQFVPLPELEATPSDESGVV